MPSLDSGYLEADCVNVGEACVRHRDVSLCVQSFGHAGDPAVLLIHGASASMLHWDAGFCQQLADRGRFVIRYDNRDTGRSTSYPPGRPGYTLRDMAEDVLAILDHFGVARAQIVGQSMGGAIAVALAVHHAARVASLVLVATTPGDKDLPAGTGDLQRFVAGAPVNGDAAALEHYIVELMRLLSADPVRFDEVRARRLARADVTRTRDMAAALVNPFRVAFAAPRGGGLAEVAVPTLVVHGEHDPVYPLAHGERLRDRIAGARLLVLEGAGHEIPPRHESVVIDAIARLPRA